MFYNPAMAFDRDLGVAFANALPSGPPEGRTGWEMTAATGVRGLRMLSETRAFSSFTLSEANPEAFGVLRQNVGRFAGATARRGDARVLPPEAPFDYVDLDPYGTPEPFVRTALAAVRPGGIVGVTATDMMVLAGAQPAACLRRYGARPVRGRLGPEGGLRILLAYCDRTAESLGRTVHPLLAYSRDHYVRAYAQVQEESRREALVAEVEPSTWTGPSLGDQGPFGPMWLGPLFDPDLVARLVPPEGAARPREVEQFLSRLREEVRVDRPFYYEANVLSSRLALAKPPSLRAILEELQALGFRGARTHARPEGFRTDASRSEVERAVRAVAQKAEGR